MPVSIRPSTINLTAGTIDSFLKLLARRVSAGEYVIIDLRNLEFIDLFAMVAIIYCCADLRDKFGCQVRLEIDDRSACSFLPRAGFFKVLGGGVELPDTFTPAQLEWMEALRGTNTELLELTPINSNEAIDNVLQQLIHILRRRLHYREPEAYDMAIVVSELSYNILDHNASSAWGLAAMQVYKPASGKFLQLVVADRGMGIKATLARNPQYAHLRSDSEAIEKSIELGASEYQDAVRGNGLYQLVELASKYSGTVHIRSGSGKLYARLDHAKRQIHSFSVAPLTGTQFSITFPAR